VLAGCRCEAGTDCVLEDVLDRPGQVLVVLDEPRREAVAEEVAPAPVAAVERLRVGSVEALQAVREPPELGLDHEVVVVRHQAEGVDAPIVPTGVAREQP